MQISDSQIRKIGENIRKNNGKIDEESLNKLQYFRTSHREPLSELFNFICTITSQINRNIIVTYRIKRFESIISKLLRLNIRLNTMTDIAGCRCIAENYNEIEEIINKIRENDDYEINEQLSKYYNLKPKETGYRSIHLSIIHKKFNKTIELQLRNKIDHDWATLVEITDLLFETKLKESKYDKDNDLCRFHKYISDIKTCTIKEKEEIILIMKKYSYFERITEVFNKNYLEVRKKWFYIESHGSKKYFIIETNKTETPNISSFSNYEEAEKNYFNIYKKSDGSNVVLTHLLHPSYKNISLAYSNYILTYHSFIYDVFNILESILINSVDNCHYRKFKLFLDLLNRHNFNYSKYFNEEKEQINEVRHTRKPFNNKKMKRKEREWIDEFNLSLKNTFERSGNLAENIYSKIPKKGIKRIIFISIAKRIFRKYRKIGNKYIKDRKLSIELKK